jgi:putative membrane protein
MKRWTQFGLACVAAVSIACGDGKRNDTASTPGAAGTEGAAGTAGEAKIDRDFIQDQLSDGNAELELARLAQERATRPEVKEFAQMMARDHETAGGELKQIANKHNVQMDTGEQKEHNDLRERLSKLSGAEFDREYMEAMVEEHEEAVNEVERQQNADNPEIRQWASKTVPTLRQHLERAQQIKKNLEQRSEN